MRAMRSLFPSVIPGCATWRRPGIHTPDGGYRYRARSLCSRPGKREAAAARCRATAASDIQTLLLVADAVDGAGPVVGNEDRTILGDNDIGRPAKIALVALNPARWEGPL